MPSLRGLSPAAWNQPFKIKLFTVVGFLIAVISSFIFVYVPSQLEEQATRNLRGKAISIAEMTAYSVGAAVHFEDREAAQDALQGARLNPELRSIVVYDRQGLVFVSYDPALGQHGALPADDDQDLFTLDTPIRMYGESVGTLKASFSLAGLRQEVRRARAAVAAISALVFLFGAIAVFGISSVMTAPLRSMMRTVARIDRGDWSQRAQVSSSDEIGVLAKSFNDMVASVQRRTRQLETEIGERQRAEEALRESEAAKQAILDAIPDLMFRIGSDGTFLAAVGDVGMFLVPPESFVGHHLRDVLPPDVAATVGASIDRTMATRQVVAFEYELPVADQVRHFEARMVPAAEAEVFAIVRDISEAKASEQARQEAEEALHEQRTLSARSDRLRSLGEMAAGIAHELNQPLAGVRGLAEHTLIGMDRDWQLEPDTLRDRLTRIIDQVERMVHIIEHIRMFAREAGEPKLDAVNINDVALAARELLGAQLLAHGINLQLTLAEDLPTVMANRFSLEEVLLNLLTNARDAVDTTRDSDQRVDVATRRDGADRVAIEVADNGPGIPAQVIERIFDPFFTTKDPDKGTGLGLAISKTIVEQVQGRLAVHTNGGGTRFVVSLPRSTCA